MQAFLLHSIKKYKAVYLTTAFTLIVIGLLFLSYQTLKETDIATQLLSIIPEGPLGTLALFGLISFGMAVGLPRQIAAFCAGFLLGAPLGALLATIAAVIGCSISYAFSRKLFSAWILDKYPSPTQKITKFLSYQTFTKSIIIRLIPAGSNFLTNLIAGATRIPSKPFILGSTIGFVPQMVIFSLIGNGVKIGSEQQLLVSAGLLAIAATLSFYLYRDNKYRK